LVAQQAILVTSMLPNFAGLLTMGAAIDAGIRVLWSNAALALLGSALGFAVYSGVSVSLAAAWGLVAVLHFVIGLTQANVALPCTRIYEPLQVRAPPARGASLPRLASPAKAVRCT
jgi:hypothetical protein